MKKKISQPLLNLKIESKIKVENFEKKEQLVQKVFRATTVERLYKDGPLGHLFVLGTL